MSVRFYVAFSVPIRVSASTGAKTSAESALKVDGIPASASHAAAFRADNAYSLSVISLASNICLKFANLLHNFSFSLLCLFAAHRMARTLFPLMLALVYHCHCVPQWESWRGSLSAGSAPGSASDLAQNSSVLLQPPTLQWNRTFSRTNMLKPR